MPIFILGGFSSGIAQVTNQHSDFRQGLKGYATAIGLDYGPV